MGLIELVIIIIVIGFLLWAATTFIPMEPNIKRILVGVVCVVVVLWIVNLLVGPIPDIQVGRQR